VIDTDGADVDDDYITPVDSCHPLRPMPGHVPPPPHDHEIIPYNIPLIDPLCWPDRKIHGLVLRKLRKTMRFIGKVSRLPGIFGKYDTPVYAEYKCLQVQYGDVVQYNNALYVYMFNRATYKFGWQLFSKLDAMQAPDVSAIVEAYNYATVNYVDETENALSTELSS